MVLCSLLGKDRRRCLLTGAVGSLALAASVAVSATGAAGTPPQPASATPAPLVRQSVPSGTCESGRECHGIDLYSRGARGRSMVPGDSVTTTARFDAEGSGATGMVLDPAPCTATTEVAGRALVVHAAKPSGSLCSVLQVSVYRGPRAVGTPFYRGSLDGFDAPMRFAVSGDPAFTFVVRLPTWATSAVQGQRVSQPLTWAFQR